MGESISVEWVRHALVLRRAGADDDAFALAETLPNERYRTPVVVGASALPALARLDPWLVADLADATEGGLRLIAPKLGAMGEDGTLPPARRLADRLGVEVVAPDGTPDALPDGSLFVREPGAGWVSYQPERPRARSGPRHPSPWWQSRLPLTLPGHVTPVPAGLWVRRPGAPERPGDPLHRGVPDHDRMYVVLGAPGEQPPEVTTVAEVLGAIPAEKRGGIVLASYGVPDLGAAIAGELGTPVRMAHGVPLDGRPVHVDETGAFTWRPFALESVYRPGETPLLKRWIAPGPALGMGGPASYRMAEGWRVDVMARGLLVRPENLAPDPEWAAGTGPTADVVLASDVPVPGEVLAALDGLMRGLPADARDHLRVVPVTEHAAAAASRLEVAASAVPFASASLRLELAESTAGEAEVLEEQVSGESEVWADEETESAVEPPSGAVVVTADGCVLPAQPILAAAALPGYSGHSDPVAGLVDEPAPPPLPSISASSAPPPLPSIATSIPIPPPAATATAGAEKPGKPTGTRQAVRAEKEPEKEPAEKDPRESGEDKQRKRDTEPAHTSDVMTVAPPDPRPHAAPGNLSIEDIRRPLTTVHLPGERTPEPPEPAGATDTEARIPKVAEALPALTPRVTAVSRSPVTATPIMSTSDRYEEPPEPVPPERPASPVVPPVVEVPADARSTPEQRQAVRGMLGPAYDVATRAVTRMLSERPGLRAIPSEHSALLAELAVVRVFAQKPTENYDTDFQICLASGLRRLPTARTVVVRGIPAETEVRPRTVLRLSSPVLVAPAVPAVAVGPAEALIWTTTARRLDGLLPEDATDLVLPGHTRLRVLAVDEGPLRRILLAEEGTPDEAALSRLRKALAARATAGAAGEPEDTRWFGPLPGIREIPR
ncbi:hypothetical protein [Amycolatopsis pigmentata]|uniref:Uncharacterized protein n=1 Tax=Amycolatopsis pigmentata TaxID=450801 RepID=A0ABW5G1G3_9PSEU